MIGVRATLVLFVATALLPALARAEGILVGAMAPPFELRGSDGELYTLAQFAGKQAVTLAWFPKAFTPG